MSCLLSLSVISSLKNVRTVFTWFVDNATAPYGVC